MKFTQTDELQVGDYVPDLGYVTQVNPVRIGQRQPITDKYVRWAGVTRNGIEIGTHTKRKAMETITLGPTPADESCAQVGSNDYHERAAVECQVYRRQLLRMYKAEHGKDLPEGCTLKITNEAHDFGTYHEVGVRYNDSFRDAIEAAFWFDANTPAHWDAEARAELEELIPAASKKNLPGFESCYACGGEVHHTDTHCGSCGNPA